MTPLADIMQKLFIVCWCVGVAAWFYAARYWLPMWAVGFKPRDRHKGYWRKVLIGFAAFMLAAVVSMIAGFVAQTWGGGW
ncbi:hypothetical protein ACETK8_00105 [Brevundimonas staleyi]|uniref:Uncharacterized protein n=1 Tax=Brevundimonas staleyi TaxID=74326 RepID=A0ABW0FUA3_9CAUL